MALGLAAKKRVRMLKLSGEEFIIMLNIICRQQPPFPQSRMASGMRQLEFQRRMRQRLVQRRFYRAEKRSQRYRLISSTRPGQYGKAPSRAMR